MALRMLKSDPEVTKQQIEMARIEQQWRQWSGPNGKPWKPIESPQENPVLCVDEVLSRGTLIVADPFPSLWRRILNLL